MEITVNTLFEQVPESIFKQKIMNMLISLNKSMGNPHTQEELNFVGQEIWKRIYFSNRKVPMGILYRFYEEALLGITVILKKITVQTILSCLTDYLAKFKERDRLNTEKFINEQENKARKNGFDNANSPIARAAVWMISKRCDGYEVDHISARQIAEIYEVGKNPNIEIKLEKKKEPKKELLCLRS